MVTNFNVYMPPNGMQNFILWASDGSIQTLLYLGYVCLICW